MPCRSPHDYIGLTETSVTMTFTAPAVTVLDISTAALIDEKGNDVLILDVTNYDDSVQNITSETNAAGASTVTGGSSLEVTVENLTANGDSFTLALNPMNDTDMHIFVD